MFAAVLSDLTLLAIQRRFLHDYVDVRNVSMRSAVAVTATTDRGSNPVGYVENCTCLASRNVAGEDNYLRYFNCNFNVRATTILNASIKISLAGAAVFVSLVIS